MLDLTSAPTAITKLVSWLLDNGFELSEESVSDRNNQNVICTKRDQLVEINATRGEWSQGGGMWGQTFHPEHWEAWLDGIRLPAIWPVSIGRLISSHSAGKPPSTKPRNEPERRERLPRSVTIGFSAVLDSDPRSRAGEDQNVRYELA